MYSLSTFCCVCLHDGEELQSLKDSDFDNVQLITKLKFCALQTDVCVLDDAAIYICIQCCHILRLAYNFKKMCIKNNKFIRGYVSQLKCTLNEQNQQTDISLQNLKDYVDNIPLAEYISQKEKKLISKKSSIKEIKREEKHEQQTQILENFEPEINIHEVDDDIKIHIEENQIQIENKKETKNKINLHPLIQNNDFQEKSSTQTLDLLKTLVHETQSAAVDKLRELITKPIVDELNDDFQYQEKENNHLQMKNLNDFETIYVKPEPTDELEVEEQNVSGGESSEDLRSSTEEIQNLLNRADNYCPICRKTFLCKSYYERHITMHTGIKNYECDVCHKRFTRKSTLKTHFMVHTGDASFTCPLCQKIFTQKGNMKSHMQTHYAVKNYRCHECGKCFSLKSNLKTHLTLHQKGSRQQCPICRKLLSKSNFAAHLNMHQEFRMVT